MEILYLNLFIFATEKVYINLKNINYGSTYWHEWDREREGEFILKEKYSDRVVARSRFGISSIDFLSGSVLSADQKKLTQKRIKIKL